MSTAGASDGPGPQGAGGDVKAGNQGTGRTSEVPAAGLAEQALTPDPGPSRLHVPGERSATCAGRIGSCSLVSTVRQLQLRAHSS